MATSPWLPLVWDEPNAMLRAEKLGEWLQLWVQRAPEQPAPWTDAGIRALCPYTTTIEGHPACYGFVIAAGRLLTAGWLAETESFRCGPSALFALAVGAFFRRLRFEYGAVAALFGVAALLTMPRVFAHMHFASIDGPLTACWLLAWAGFGWARRSQVGCVVWGVLLGLTMSCKFTGWLAIFGFVAWAAVHRDRAALRACAVGGVVALLTFFDLNPPLWNDPLGGLWQFFALNTGRGKIGLNIPTLFFGERCDLNHPLPWYNPLAWIVLTVPPGTVLLAGVGAVRAIRCRREEPFGIGLLLLCGVLVVVKGLPFAPPHDAERLFLPSFAFLAGLAAVGCREIADWSRGPAGWRSKLGPPVLCLVLAASAAETVWYAPQWLSYYSPVVGGVSGAARAGLEPTYYWDGLDHEVVQWIESHAEDAASVYCPVSPEFALMKSRESRSRLKYSVREPAQCDWYLVQHRPSLWSAADRTLLATETPRFVKTIRDPARGFGPWRLDVPLVWVFSREQFLRARHELSGSR